MVDYSLLSATKLAEGIKSGKFTCQSVVEHFIKKIEDAKDYNAIIEIFDDAITAAEQIDTKVKNGEPLGKLAGVPVIIKDNILYKGHHASCASAFMKDYIAPYSATIVEKLLAEDAVIIARANMDEFAMGGSCEKSVYGATKNAHDKTRVAGGSSGGSAVAVALGLCPVAIGTDTGGSIRQPSSFNGVVGIKPSYGTVSRYGIVAFASSTDQASPITKNLQDNKLVLQILAGKDANDQTTIASNLGQDCSKKPTKVGVIKELKEGISGLEQSSQFNACLDKLKGQGIEVVEVSVPHITKALACYYIIAPAEATSNLSRFDGVKYTTRAQDAKTLEEVYIKSRSEGFGDEVKRRIMLGNFVLSSGYFDAYYKKAKRLQTLLGQEFSVALRACDCLLSPTTPGEAFKIGAKTADPVTMYLEDLFTVPASIAGIPALSVPYSVSKNGLPLGLQIMGAVQNEEMLYKVGELIIGEADK